MACDYSVWMKLVIYAHLAEKPCKFPQLHFPVDTGGVEWKWQLGFVVEMRAVSPDLYLIYLTWETCLPTYHQRVNRTIEMGAAVADAPMRWVIFEPRWIDAQSLNVYQALGLFPW